MIDPWWALVFYAMGVFSAGGILLVVIVIAAAFKARRDKKRRKNAPVPLASVDKIHNPNA